MYEHATIPNLPVQLWQAAFFLDLVVKCSDCTYSLEAKVMAEKMGRECDRVLVWRKEKLGW